MGEGYRSLALGLKFAGGIMVYAAVGFLLDWKLGSMPVGTVTGTVVGSALSFYAVYRSLTAAEAKAKAALRDKAAPATTSNDEAGRPT